MRHKRLLWQLFPSYLLVTLFSLLAVTWYATRSLRQFYLEQTAADLETQASLLEDSVQEQLAANDFVRLQAMCRELRGKIPFRVTVVLPTGEVLCDSEEDPRLMDDHGDRPEIMAALAQGAASATRFSHTLQKDMMYVAKALEVDGGLAGVLRLAVPLGAIREALAATYKKIALAGIVAAVLAAVVSLAVSRRLSRPLEQLREGAERFAKGDLKHNLPVPPSREIAGLAQAMNEMAAQLDDRIRTILNQRNEQEAVLSSMVEGVLAVDTDERLLSLNHAAAQMLDVDPERVQGRSIQEVVRNPALQALVADALASQSPVEGDIILREGGAELFLQAQGRALRDAHNRGIGALIVLNNVTHLRRLENIRRDFVANVSHELRTPITSIKGFVETLIDGGVRNDADTKRFLRIILKQVNRFNAIIEDLLSLSRIEQESEETTIELQHQRVRDVLEAAVQACGSALQEKAMRVEMLCPEDLRFDVNAVLLEQAVTNLIDNAIKYSDAGKPVRIEADSSNGHLVISVRDQGCGIEKKHLDRLFERFYRVDHARSRKLGGTGLGLAIVKHIVNAHGGRVNVESAPGQGSVFSIHIPARPSR